MYIYRFYAKTFLVDLQGFKRTISCLVQIIVFKIAMSFFLQYIPCKSCHLACGFSYSNRQLGLPVMSHTCDFKRTIVSCSIYRYIFASSFFCVFPISNVLCSDIAILPLFIRFELQLIIRFKMLHDKIPFLVHSSIERFLISTCLRRT